MKYFCIANPIPLIKLTYSPRLLDNLPLTGTPIFGKLPITKAKLKTVFDSSENFIVCKTVEDANTLRFSKMTPNNNVTSDFLKHDIAKGYPLADYGIYEIDTDAEIKFSELNKLSLEELQTIVDRNVYFPVLYSNDRSHLPNIYVSVMQKSQLNPTLIDSHYFSLEDGKPVSETKSCQLL